MKLYLAGPLFTTAEQEFNRQLRDRLESVGHEVWLPQEHEPRERSAQAIFEADVAGLEGAEVVVANVDGSDPGLRYLLGMRLRLQEKAHHSLSHRFPRGRRCAGSPFNLMLSASAVKVILAPLASVEELARRIASTLAELPVG